MLTTCFLGMKKSRIYAGWEYRFIYRLRITCHRTRERGADKHVKRDKGIITGAVADLQQPLVILLHCRM